jgi:type I restriction enzyme S subunit
MAPTLPKAFAVRFASINRWDPNSFHKIEWHWDQSIMKPLGSVLTPRKEKVERDGNGLSDLMPVTIHFDGSIEPRKVSEDKEYTMDLFRARPGDIVASKIDLKNGAVAIIPDEWDTAVVTNHFAVYAPDLDQIIPQYFHLLIQAKFVKEHLWRNKVGAEGRKEVKIEFFESLKIPIPPLPVQQKIVACWEKAKNAAMQAQQGKSALIEELNQLMIGQTHKYKLLRDSRLFSASFSQAPQWDVKAGRAAVFKEANPSFVRLGDYTEECANMIKPWEEEDKIWPIYGVNNKGGVFLSTEQHTKVFNAAYKRIEKDWFFHNPTRANVGSLGIVPKVPDDAVTSPEYQVWKLTGGFEPEFMDLLLQTEYFLTLVSFNRVGGVKQRMYYANLAEIRLPLIPCNVQKKYLDQKVQFEQLQEKSKERLLEVKKDVEKLILGTLSVKEH